MRHILGEVIEGYKTLKNFLINQSINKTHPTLARAVMLLKLPSSLPATVST